MRVATFLMIATVMTGGAAAAGDDGRLPLIALVTPAGQASTSASLVRPGHWALIYVPTECGGCGSLLRLIVKEEHPQLPPRIAIIVAGATADAVRAAVAQFPDLAQAAWFADPTGASAIALQLGTAPAVIGLDGDAIEWTISGVLAGSPDIKMILERWAEQ